MSNILAVDTQIVMIGCNMAGCDPKPCHCNLLNAFHDKARLALDKHTRQEYQDNMAEQSEGRRWLTRLSLNDRIEFFARVPKVKRATSVKLQKIGFSKRDTKFLHLALATTSKHLVAEEPHFVNVQAMLKKAEGIVICDMAHPKKSATLTKGRFLEFSRFSDHSMFQFFCDEP
jgi:hypothetical protein